MSSFIQPILNTYKTYVNMTRMRRILAVLFKNGLGMFFSHFVNLVPSRYRGSNVSEVLSVPQRLRKALVELGPTYVKLGQILSTRPDLIGQECAQEFTKLQDQVPPFPFEQVKQIIKRELGGPVEQFFQSFSEQASAAASMAQGHRAVLLDGTKVFVKVQRPGIRKEVLSDVDILEVLAKYVHENMPELRYLMLPRMATQFRESMLEELDFNNERGNIKHFARQFAGRAGLVVPRVWDNLSSAQILTMEWIEGIKADHTEELQKLGYDLPKLADLGAELALEQYFTHGFFHADPHPGNIFVLPGNRISYIDFGLCGRITREERDLFCRLLMSVLEHDERRVARMLLKLTVYENEPDVDDLECAIGEFIDRNFYGEIQDLDVPGAILQLYEICHRFRISLKPHIYLLVKAMGMSDALGTQLNPKFDIEAHLEPYVKKEMLSHLDFTKTLHGHLEDLLDFGDNLSRLPAAVRQFWAKLMKGQLTLRQELVDKDEILKLYIHGQNRRAVADVIAGLLVGAGLMLYGKLPPLWNGASVYGLLGLVGALALMVILAVDILRVDK